MYKSIYKFIKSLIGATYVIVSIDADGSVRLKRYLENGDLDNLVIKSRFEIFTQKYKHTNKVRSMLASWPAEDIALDSSFLVAEKQMLVQFLLASGYRSSERPDVSIQEKPRAGVFVNRAYARGELKLVAYGKVSIIEIKEALPPRAIEIKGVDLIDKKAFMKASQEKTQGVNPLGHIRYCESAEEATCKIEWRASVMSKLMGNQKITLPSITNVIPLVQGQEITLPTTWSPAGKSVALKRQVILSNASASSAKKVKGD